MRDDLINVFLRKGFFLHFTTQFKFAVFTARK